MAHPAGRLYVLRLRLEQALARLGEASRRLGLEPAVARLARPLLVDEELRHEPFIVVLSGGIRSTGRLSEATRRRLVHGVGLYHRGLAPRLLLSGGPRGPHRPSGAPRMGALAEALGVPGNRIVLEGRSSRTAENARETAKLLRAEGIGSILLVTSPAHMRRAKLCFEAQGIAVAPAPAPGRRPVHRVHPTANSDLISLDEVLHEYLGLIFYRALGWV